ncbi:MAG TPA: hypothetical protein DG761_07520 [Gammaproteobacteria bacterium]|nr:hypothetical protein [Gammaproteobacteria bacterium]
MDCAFCGSDSHATEAHRTLEKAFSETYGGRAHLVPLRVGNAVNPAAVVLELDERAIGDPEREGHTLTVFFSRKVRADEITSSDIKIAFPTDSAVGS